MKTFAGLMSRWMIPWEMRCLEPIENLDGDIEQAIHIQPGRQDEVFQRDAVEELHGHKQTPVVLAYVIQRADVGMIEQIPLAPRVESGHVFAGR